MPPIKVFSNAPLHPDGVTPKTAAPAENEQIPQPTPTRTTNLPLSNPSQPPPPQPGARPQPGPAPTAGLSSGPPPPQPGAEPRPVYTVTHTSTTTGTMPTPSQLSIPPPTSNYAPTHSTSTYQPAQPAHVSPFETGAAASSTTAGVGLHNRKISLEHPPGYVQNPYSQDGSASDRARFENAAREARAEEGVVGQLKSALSGAGKKLTELETEAWRWAQGKK